MGNIYDIAKAEEELYKGEEKAVGARNKAEIEGKEWRGDLREGFMDKQKSIQLEAKEKQEKALDKFKKWKGGAKLLGKGLSLIPGFGKAAQIGFDASTNALLNYQYGKDLKKGLGGLGGFGSQYAGTFLEDSASGIDTAMADQLKALDPKKMALGSLESSLVGAGTSALTGAIGDKITGAISDKALAKIETMIENNPDLKEKFGKIDELINKEGFDKEALKKIKSGAEGLEFEEGVDEDLKGALSGLKGEELQQYVARDKYKGGDFAHLKSDTDAWSLSKADSELYGEGETYDEKLAELKELRKKEAEDEKLFGRQDKQETWDEAGGFFGFKGGEGYKGGIGKIMAEDLWRGAKEPFSKKGFKDILSSGFEADSLDFYQPFLDDYTGKSEADLQAPTDWFQLSEGWRHNIPK